MNSGGAARERNRDDELSTQEFVPFDRTNRYIDSGRILCMERLRLGVQANSGFLKQALVMFLASALGGVVDVGGFPTTSVELADIVVAVNSSCPPDACRALTRMGSSVIVLAAIPTALEESRYLSAGAAAYLPMEANSRALLDAVTRVMAARAAPVASSRLQQGPIAL